MKDDLGDRMKWYEQAEAGRRLIPLLPIMARIDGRCFSAFTRGMERPYDKRLSTTMISTALELANETNACMTYTQSDEINLAWLQPVFDSEPFFGGKIQKLTSVLASIATAAFAVKYRELFDAPRIATFDCRVWNVPNPEEGANVFLWRALDAKKNSVSMLARCHFSHKQLLGLGQAAQLALLDSIGVVWEGYPDHFKRGTWLQRRTTKRRFSAEEMDKLPPKHEARLNPDLEIGRTGVEVLRMPPFKNVKNRVGVVFYGEEPRVE